MSTERELNNAERAGLEYFACPGVVRGSGIQTLRGNFFGNSVTIDLDQRDPFGTAKILKRSWVTDEPALPSAPVKRNLFTKLFKGK